MKKKENKRGYQEKMDLIRPFFSVNFVIFIIIIDIFELNLCYCFVFKIKEYYSIAKYLILD